MEKLKNWFKSLSLISVLFIFVIIALPIFIVPIEMIIPTSISVLLLWAILFYINIKIN